MPAVCRVLYHWYASHLWYAWHDLWERPSFPKSCWNNPTDNKLCSRNVMVKWRFLKGKCTHLVASLLTTYTKFNIVANRRYLDLDGHPYTDYPPYLCKHVHYQFKSSIYPDRGYKLPTTTYRLALPKRRLQSAGGAVCGYTCTARVSGDAQTGAGDWPGATLTAALRLDARWTPGDEGCPLVLSDFINASAFGIVAGPITKKKTVGIGNEQPQSNRVHWLEVTAYCQKSPLKNGMHN